jgi:hypothetical protein
MGDVALPERVSVQMICTDMARVGRTRTRPSKEMLSKAGSAVARRFKQRVGAGEVARTIDGRLSYKAYGGQPEIIESVDIQVARHSRMRHDVAYGLSEVHGHAVYNPWTYPPDFKVDIEAIVSEMLS